MSSPEPGFEEFYAAHASRMVKVAYSIVGDQHAAQDVVQSAFEKAFAAWWRVRRADDPLAYTRRIVVNTALAHLRKPAQRFERSIAEVPDRRAGQLQMTETRPEEVWDLLGQLPPRRRAIVVLRYYEGLSEREIADVLGCRPGTVKSQAFAALKALRTELGTRQVEGDSAKGHLS